MVIYWSLSTIYLHVLHFSFGFKQWDWKAFYLIRQKFSRAEIFELFFFFWPGASIDATFSTHKIDSLDNCWLIRGLNGRWTHSLAVWQRFICAGGQTTTQYRCMSSSYGTICLVVKFSCTAASASEYIVCLDASSLLQSSIQSNTIRTRSRWLFCGPLFHKKNSTSHTYNQFDSLTRSQCFRTKRNRTSQRTIGNIRITLTSTNNYYC